MLTNPRIGSVVQVWYRVSFQEMMPHHGALGVVLFAKQKRPRNHVIDIKGVPAVVPFGNLRKVDHGRDNVDH
jgi:hypothetical protein